MKIVIENKMFGFFSLKIPKELSETKSQKISSSTPQISFIKTHRNDIQSEIGALQELLGHLKIDRVRGSIIDLMAVCGFSASLLQSYCYCGDVLYLNDMDITCLQILKLNFPNASLSQFDLLKEDGGLILPKTKLAFIDFNSFTVKSYEKWKNLIKKIKSDWLILTDSASFGFKFGHKNLYSYGVKTPQEYYELLSEKIFGINGMRAKFVAPFGPAALIAFHKTNREKIEFIESKKTSLFFYPNGGLIG